MNIWIRERDLRNAEPRSGNARIIVDERDAKTAQINGEVLTKFTRDVAETPDDLLHFVRLEAENMACSLESLGHGRHLNGHMCTPLERYRKRFPKGTVQTNTEGWWQAATETPLTVEAALVELRAMFPGTWLSIEVSDKPVIGSYYFIRVYGKPKQIEPAPTLEIAMQKVREYKRDMDADSNNEMAAEFNDR